MTEKQPRTQFLDSLDHKTLEAIEERLEKLQPLVAEYHELQRRRAVIETRHGLNRTSEQILRALAEHPEGLSCKEMSAIIDRPSNAIRSTAADLVKKGQITRLTRGRYGYITADGVTAVITQRGMELAGVDDREESLAD